MLESPNDNDVLATARKLVRELKGNGSDLRTLANALEAEWEKQQKAKPAPPPPIDYSKVEAAIARYAADRTTVQYHLLWKALIAEVPALVNRGGGASITGYIHRFMRGLGFTASASHATWRSDNARRQNR